MVENLALGRPATQSSVSEWSRARTPEADARGGNNGVIDGEAGFHTAVSALPWWQVDLQSVCLIQAVHLFNRRHCAARLRHFTILGSMDGAQWLELFRKSDDTVFGEDDLLPYVARLSPGDGARFVRIRLDGTEPLHFCECQVLGTVADADTARSLAASFVARAAALDPERAQRATALTAGRRGHIAVLDGLSVFVDTDRYSKLLIDSLGDGGYEWRERALIRGLLRPDDRVLDLGTAVGIVAMAAADIVGADNVVTYDANPLMTADATRNFVYNRKGSIRARTGVLVNRTRFAKMPPRVDFFVSRDFWASRLAGGPNVPDIIETIAVPTMCLEDEIAAHRATVITCDIEGGEAELFRDADLTGIRLLMMELHPGWAGQDAMDAMIRYLITRGFNIDFFRTADGIAVLRR